MYAQSSGEKLSGETLNAIKAGSEADLHHAVQAVLPVFNACVLQENFVEAAKLVKEQTAAVNSILACTVIANQHNPFFDNMERSTMAFRLAQGSEFKSSYTKVCSMLLLGIMITTSSNPTHSLVPEASSYYVQVMKTMLRLLLHFILANDEDQKHSYLSVEEHVKAGTHALIEDTVDLLSHMAAKDVEIGIKVAAEVSRDEMWQTGEERGRFGWQA